MYASHTHPFLFITHINTISIYKKAGAKWHITTILLRLISTLRTALYRAHFKFIQLQLLRHYVER